MFLRSAFNYDRDEASVDSGLLFTENDEDQAKQEFKDECDINTILKRFNITGQLPADVRMPTFGDFTGVGTFHDAVNAIALANEAFDEMPADVRARFGNDPAAFVAFCSDPANLAEARKMGLVPAEELPPAVEVPAAAPAAAPVAAPGSAVVGTT